MPTKMMRGIGARGLSGGCTRTRLWRRPAARRSLTPFQRASHYLAALAPRRGAAFSTRVHLVLSDGNPKGDPWLITCAPADVPIHSAFLLWSS